MQEAELKLGDLIVLVLRKWRALVCIGLVFALIFGAGKAIHRVITITSPENQERLQSEYEAKYSQYWGAINTVDRDVRNNENYIKRAERKLEMLERKEENYLFSIEDLEAEIAYFGLRIEDLEARIEVLEAEKEKKAYQLEYQTEQNENSLFLAIDPYDVNTSEIFIRVDSNYQILPGNIYQNPDITPELLQTYRMLVNNAAFLETMIADLNLDTEVRYLTEVATVKEYSENALRIRVIGKDGVQTQRVAEYLRDAILANHSNLSRSIGTHTVEVYSSRNYSIVDMDVFAQQQEQLTKATTLEDNIRDIDANILNVQASIRQYKADIRQMEVDIEDINVAIDSIPVEEETLNSSIATYQDTINQLRIQRLNLLEKPEPKPARLTPVGLVKNFVIYGVVGGAVGMVLGAAWLALYSIQRNKVLSVKFVASILGVGFFGTWSAEKAPGKKLPAIVERVCAAVDRFVDQLVGPVKADEDLVCANIAAAALQHHTLLLCGGADEDQISNVAALLRKKCPDLTVLTAGSPTEDPNAATGLARCDAVVLVETVYRSGMEPIQHIYERAQAMNKPILGVVSA